MRRRDFNGAGWSTLACGLCTRRKARQAKNFKSKPVFGLRVEFCNQNSSLKFCSARLSVDHFPASLFAYKWSPWKIALARLGVCKKFASILFLWCRIAGSTCFSSAQRYEDAGVIFCVCAQTCFSNFRDNPLGIKV